MNKQFKLIGTISILILLISAKNAMTQTTKSSAATRTEETDLEKEKTRYSKFLDSLLLEGDYKNVVELGERLKLNRVHEYSQIAIPYLITGNYFLGHQDKSKQLLDKWLSNMGYNEIINLLTNDNIAFIKYFNEPGIREPIVKMAIEDYKKKATATDQKAGEKIIRFYINDQVYRKLKYAYKKDDQINQAKILQLFKLQDSIQNANVYAFYRKHGKYFNNKEVGESVSWYQPIILSHYDNIELRQTFFKDLLEKAVKEGRMEKTSYVNFILRTESFTNPKFFEHLEARMEEVRKEYDLPDYLWNPF